MQSLRTIDAPSLLKNTKTLVNEERRITLELIDHLREIERRLLFAELGYGSLFEFVVKHLGLSEGSAQRRISAMRLSRDIPEAKVSLANGDLSLSNAAKLHSVFRSEKKAHGSLPQEVKLDILKSVSGMSQKECELKLYELLPETMETRERETVRAIGPIDTELKLIIGPELKEKLTRLQELFSHQLPGTGYLELLEFLATRELSREERKRGLAPPENAERASRRPNSLPAPKTLPASNTSPHSAAVRTRKVSSTISNDLVESGFTSLPVPVAKSAQVKSEQERLRRTIPSSIRRTVWARAHGRCEYSGCTSRFQLEIDHVLPVSLGGINTLKNLRLLCRTHNVQQATQALGSESLRRFIPSLR